MKAQLIYRDMWRRSLAQDLLQRSHANPIEGRSAERRASLDIFGADACEAARMLGLGHLPRL